MLQRGKERRVGADRRRPASSRLGRTARRPGARPEPRVRTRIRGHALGQNALLSRYWSRAQSAEPVPHRAPPAPRAPRDSGEKIAKSNERTIGEGKSSSSPGPCARYPGQPLAPGSNASPEGSRRAPGKAGRAHAQLRRIGAGSERRYPLGLPDLGTVPKRHRLWTCPKTRGSRVTSSSGRPKRPAKTQDGG